MGVRQTLRNRQPKAYIPWICPGSKKRIKHLAQILGRDPVAGVKHLDTRPRFVLEQPHPNLSIFSNRIQGILQNIIESNVQLATVAEGICP
jgi:hypothetical protein